MEKRLQLKKMLWRVMKITFIQMIMLGVFCTMGYASPTKAQDILSKDVSLKANSVTVKSILSQIEKQTNVKFVYSDTRIPIDRKTSIVVNNEKLSVVLTDLLSPLNVQYRATNNYIVLTKSKVKEALIDNEPIVVESIVKGTVIDEANNEPIIGASVALKGTTKGTLTDANGSFTLALTDAEKNGSLVISFVGYESQTIAINGRETINISLKAGASLDEVVVTGVFDARTRLEASSAISIMKTKDIERVAATSAADYLKNIPGVYVDASAGETRNTITTRGLTLFPAAAGYNYVSMQEDGLPMSNFNYGTDNFLRPDVTTARIEALRGGSATVTGANAPGGIFNYISKTGGETMEGEARAKFGLEGDGSIEQI